MTPTPTEPPVHIPRLSPAQQFALTLIGEGTYWAHEATGGARRHPHRPGVTPVVRRQTLYSLAVLDLVEYDPTRHGLLRLTPTKGVPVLAALRARKKARS